MPTALSVAGFLEALIEAEVLTPEQLTPFIANGNEVPNKDVSTLAHCLVRQGLITLYQAQQICRNRVRGLRLGKYLILDKLGEGGMGLVFKARDCQLGRIVALKVLRGELAHHAIARRRFEREARAAAAVSHPHIVTLYEADQIGGRLYLAMEYVPGRDLAQILRQEGPLPLSQACEYVRQAAVGLHQAHAVGLIHRDVKPANLLLVSPDQSHFAHFPWGFIKLSDLGMARLACGGDSQTTGDGTMIGTVDYMAPEQARSARSADAQSDLYSLGCTLFHLATGRLPFEGENLIEKMLKHQQESPPDLRRYLPEAPEEVADLIARLLAKRREERPASAAEVADVLAPFCREIVAPAGSRCCRMAVNSPLPDRTLAADTPVPLAEKTVPISIDRKVPVTTPASPRSRKNRGATVGPAQQAVVRGASARSASALFQGCGGRPTDSATTPSLGTLLAALIIGCLLVVVTSAFYYRPGTAPSSVPEQMPASASTLELRQTGGRQNQLEPSEHLPKADWTWQWTSANDINAERK
jgi:serine/threonine-protein kinase